MGGDSAPLCCETPPAELHPLLGPQHKKDVDLTEGVQEATKMLHWLKCLCSGDRLGELGLFSPDKRRLQGL